MDLKKLYQEILSRENIHYESIKPRQRIAIVTSSGELDIMKANKVGQGRASLDEEMRYMVVAKICPGQSSMRLGIDNCVRLNELMEVTTIADIYGTDISLSNEELGVLQHRLKAYWVDLNLNTAVKRITKSEMRKIQMAIP